MKIKTTKQLILIAVILMLPSLKTNAAKENVNILHNKLVHSFSFLTATADDPNIVLNVVKLDWDVNLQISFNGNEGATGTLKIYNSSNQLINQFNVNLVSSPNFSNISLAEWAAGTYSVELTTSSGVHTSHFTV